MFRISGGVTSDYFNNFSRQRSDFNPQKSLVCTPLRERILHHFLQECRILCIFCYFDSRKQQIMRPCHWRIQMQTRLYWIYVWAPLPFEDIWSRLHEQVLLQKWSWLPPYHRWAINLIKEILKNLKIKRSWEFWLKFWKTLPQRHSAKCGIYSTSHKFWAEASQINTGCAAAS